jgi:hypothetical protein
MRVIKTIIPVLLLVQGIAYSCLSGRLSAESVLPGSSQQAAYNPLGGPGYPLVQDSYFTDDSGNILMIVNVLGEVNRQGQIVVRENADFSTILALSGGLRQDANLKKVIVARQTSEGNGLQAYTIDIRQFYKRGDRSSFVALKPNDTIIFPEKSFSLSKIARVVSIIYPWVSLYDVIQRD